MARTWRGEVRRAEVWCTYPQGEGVSVLFYSGTEEEEWHDGTVCRHGMRTVAHNRKPYYDVKFVDGNGTVSFAWVAPHKDVIRSKILT